MTRRTVLRGPFTMTQDITKGLASYLWTAEGKTAVDGSEGIYYKKRHANDTHEFTARDGTPIIRCTFSLGDSDQLRYLTPDWPRVNLDRSYRLSGLAYMDESWYSRTILTSTGIDTYLGVFIENEPGFRDVNIVGRWPRADQILSYANTKSAQQSTVVGWMQWELNYDSVTHKMSGRMWQPPDADPVTPQVVTEDGKEQVPFPGSSPASYDFGMFSFSTANAEVAWLKLEILS